MLLRWPFCLFLFKFMYEKFSGFKMFKKNPIQKIETDSRTDTVFSGERCDTCLFMTSSRFRKSNPVLMTKKGLSKGSH